MSLCPGNWEAKVFSKAMGDTVSNQRTMLPKWEGMIHAW